MKVAWQRFVSQNLKSVLSGVILRDNAKGKNSIQLYEDITVAVKQPEIVLQIRHSGKDKESKGTHYTKGRFSFKKSVFILEIII